MAYKETTKAEVVAQARASSNKLGCDPDLLELMAIRIWDAAMETATTRVRHLLDDYEERKKPLQRINLIRMRSMPDANTALGQGLIETAGELLEMPGRTFRRVIEELQELK